MRRVSPPYLGAAVTSFVVALVFPLALVHAQRPVPDESWARQFGTDRFDQANGIAVLDGNVYVAGDVRGALPGQVNEFPNEMSAFVRKYDSQGNVAWTSQFGGTSLGEDTATGVAAAAGAVYVAGWTAGVLPGQSTLSDAHDAFVRKYDVNGAVQWTRQFGTEAGVEANAVAADASGVYVAGEVTCCGSPLPGTLGSTGTDAFVRKYSPDGTVLWTRQFGSVDVDRATGMAIDQTGIYVVGTTNGEFAGPRGQTDGWLAKFSTDGATLFSKQFGTTDYLDEPNAVAVGASGIYVVGRTTGPMQGKMPLGMWDSFVMQFNSDGILQWTRQFGGPGGSNSAQGVAVGLTHLIVTGAADGALPGQPFVGGVDGFFRLYDFTGAEAGTREFGDGLNDVGTGAAADLRAFYIAGSKNGTALGLTSLGDNDAFVMKMAPKPLEKEDVKLPPARGGRAGRAGRAGRGN